jgi:transcriptional regulator with XRE-family HTH domain
MGVSEMSDGRLRTLRKKKGYTQVKVQLLTGIDQSDYSKIEKGIRYPTVEQSKRLAVAFGTSTDYILGLTDVEKPYPRKK